MADTTNENGEVDESQPAPTKEMAKAGLKPFKGVSCGTLFDELWLCYSPIHQFNSLYRFGQLDTCDDKFERWTDCLMSKTSGPYRAAAVNRESERMSEALKNPPLWEIRNKNEARKFWNDQYPFLKKKKEDENYSTGKDPE